MVEVGEGKLPPEKIGTAHPYFPKQSFYFRHLSFGNAGIVSFFRRIGDFVSCWLSNGTFSISFPQIGTIDSMAASYPVVQSHRPSLNIILISH